MAKYSLTHHPDTPPDRVRSIDVDLRRISNDSLFIGFCVNGAEALILPDGAWGRRAGLWKSTCFELFAKTLGVSGYREFNFAPALSWAAYAFTDWRRGMKDLPLTSPPNLVDCRVDDRANQRPKSYALDVVVELEALPEFPMKLGLSAVIDERGGKKSFWALKHPPGAPNFHHPDCFALELPPISQP